MGLFDFIFKKAPKPKGPYAGAFKLLSGYTPHFSSYGGEIYEMELVRAAINTISTHVSKLDVIIQGSARPNLRNRLKHAPNQWQTWGQFLYRLCTILYVHNTAYIVPVYDEYGEVSGIFPVLPDRVEIVQYGDTPYLRYHFSGNTAAIELDLCGIMIRFQYRDDMIGESNRALNPTMELLNIQNQGIREGVKSAASYRFWATLNNYADPDDLAEERKRFSRLNFADDAEGGGLLLFPNTYTNVHQAEIKPWVVDAEEMKTISAGVYNYFGVNEDVMQNKAFGDAWSAFYEGTVEVFAIQLSSVLDKMLFTLRERSQGNRVTATANRLQYMSNADKLQVSAQMLDRGIMSINEVREIWNLPPVDDGDERIIRGEYYNANEKVTEQEDSTDEN